MSVGLAGCGTGHTIDPGAALYNVYKKIEAGPAWANAADTAAVRDNLANATGAVANCMYGYTGTTGRLERYICLLVPGRLSRRREWLAFSESPDGASIAPIPSKLAVSLRATSVKSWADWKTTVAVRDSREHLKQPPLVLYRVPPPRVLPRACDAYNGFVSVGDGNSCAVGGALEQEVFLGRNPAPANFFGPLNRWFRVTSPTTGRMFRFDCRSPNENDVLCRQANGSAVYLGLWLFGQRSRHRPLSAAP